MVIFWIHFMRSRSNFAKNYGAMVGRGVGGIIESLLLHTRYLRHWTQGVWDIFHASPERVRQDLKYLSGLFYSACALERINFEEVLFRRRIYDTYSRSQLPCGPRRGFAAARLLGLWARIPPKARMSVSCNCWVFSGIGLCAGIITRPEESYLVLLSHAKKVIYTNTMKNIVIKHLTPYDLPELYLRREETWSGSSGSFYKTARHHVREESIVHSRRHANLNCNDRVLNIKKKACMGKRKSRLDQGVYLLNMVQRRRKWWK